MGVIFGLPVVSIFIFIAAGLLLGHLFWYSDTGPLEERIRELDEELATSNGDSSSQHGEVLSLTRSLDQKSGDLERVRIELATMRDQNAKLEASLYETTDAGSDELQCVTDQLLTLQDEHDSVKSQLAQAIEDITAAEQRVVVNESATLDAGNELGRQNELIDSLTKTNEAQAKESTRFKNASNT